jgi:prevent-host-death family protein
LPDPAGEVAPVAETDRNSMRARLLSIRVGVHEAKTRLSELLRLVDGGQEIEIARGGEPVARLVPFRERYLLDTHDVEVIPG